MSHLERALRACGLACVMWAMPAWSAPEMPIIKFGFYLPTIRDVNMADIKVSLQVWADELGKPYGYQVITALYDDMSAMRSAMNRLELHFVNASGMELAETFAPDELQGGYARRIQGVDEGLALVTNSTSGIHAFSDLRGKRLVRLSRDRLSEIFLETQCLKAAGKKCQEYLVLTEERRDIQSVYSVFFGKADAALVALSTLHTAAELNPQIKQRLRVISDWRTTAMSFGMMTRHADLASRDIMMGSVKETLKSPRGRQMLELFKADYLEVVDASALKPYWALLQEYRALDKARGAKTK